jgi:hypothetical protein
MRTSVAAAALGIEGSLSDGAELREPPERGVEGMWAEKRVLPRDELRVFLECNFRGLDRRTS